MKVFRLVLTVLVAFLTACGGGGGGGESESGSASSACGAFRVLNGVECSNDNLPVVRLIVDGVAVCTGTVISNDEVLTAGHCIGQNGMVAEHDHGTLSASGALPNPLRQTSSAFDIGIARFPGIASNFGLTPAHFSLNRRTQVGDKIKTIGYGDDGTPTLANGNPRATELVVSEVSEGFVTTLFNSTNSSPCHGDSGSAATFNGLIVANVIGGGIPGVDTCSAGSTAFFADLQINGNVDFIKQHAPGAVFE